MVLTVTRWQPGFQKVRFTQMLRHEAGYSLAGAKAATDELLAGGQIALSAAEGDVARIVRAVTELGAECTFTCESAVREGEPMRVASATSLATTQA